MRLHEANCYTYVIDDGKPIVCIYRGEFGHCQIHGEALARFLIRQNDELEAGNYSMGFLAVNMVLFFNKHTHHKDYALTSTDFNKEKEVDYIYIVSKNHVLIKRRDQSIFFDGSFEEYFLYLCKKHYFIKKQMDEIKNKNELSENHMRLSEEFYKEEPYNFYG